MRNDTYTGATVRLRLNMTAFDGRIRPGQRGIVLRVSNVSHPPVQVRNPYHPYIAQRGGNSTLCA